MWKHSVAHCPMLDVHNVAYITGADSTSIFMQVTSNWGLKTQFLLKNKNQLDATNYSFVLLIGSTCFGHYYVRYQEPATIMLITALVVWFCRDGSGSFSVKLWFLVVYVWCEVLCCLVVAANVFLLILMVVIFYAWWPKCSLVCGVFH